MRTKDNLNRGAQRGNKSRQGFRKEYDPRLVETIRDLAAKGYSMREIATAISGDANVFVSQSTVCRIQQQFGIKKSTYGIRVNLSPVIALEKI